MKKPVIILGALLSLCVLIYVAYQAILFLKIDNPEAESCTIQTERITKITEGSSKDIVFTDNHGDHYYINRGLDRGLNLDTLQAKVLNKTVTLHLPKVLGGMATSEHIAQIAVGDEIIFSELK